FPSRVRGICQLGGAAGRLGGRIFRQRPSCGEHISRPCPCAWPKIGCEVARHANTTPMVANDETTLFLITSNSPLYLNPSRTAMTSPLFLASPLPHTSP